MDFTEEMLESICMDVLGTTDVKIGDNDISFKRPFKRISMIDAIKEHTGIDISKMNESELKETCNKLNVPIDDTMGKGKMIDEIFGEKCESNYIQPTFITDYPVEMSPLAKLKPSSKEIVERFEAFVLGHELANAFSELNDPIDQRNRFIEQENLRKNVGDQEADRLDEDFLVSIEHGMPPTGGLGIGIDRLVMLLTEQDQIREVLLFPQLRSRE